MQGALMALALVLACLGILRPAAAQSSPANVVKEPARLPVTINGREYALEALVVRRPGENKLPVALITHGSSPDGPHAANLGWVRGWAHDLAHRGWLAVAVMRRGYGNSDGEAADDAGPCAAPDGRQLLLPKLDAFLRANGLPTWDPATFGPLLARVPQQDRPGVEDYLHLPAEKALALGPKAGLYWHYDERTLDDAHSRASRTAGSRSRRSVRSRPRTSARPAS